MACENSLSYPGFNEDFKIHTDARKFQLGEVIIQKFKTIAFHSRKIIDVQKRYTKIEKGLLGIVETLKSFRTILIGQILRIYSYHKTLHV